MPSGEYVKKLEMFCLNLDLFLGESRSSTSHFFRKKSTALLGRRAFERGERRSDREEREREERMTRERGERRERERGERREEKREREERGERERERSSPRDTERVTRPVETSGFWGDWVKTRGADPRAFHGVLPHKEFSKPDVTGSFMHHPCFSDPFVKKGRDGTQFMWDWEPQLRAWARTCCHFTHGKKTTL